MDVLSSRRGQRNIGDNICQTIRIGRAKQDHKRAFYHLATRTAGRGKNKRESLGAVMRLIIIMEQQQAPLTVVGDIMLKWGSFSFSRVSWFAKTCCACECVCLCVVSRLLPDRKHGWLSPAQSCHFDTPSSWPSSTLLLINRCCCSN